MDSISKRKYRKINNDFLKSHWEIQKLWYDHSDTSELGIKCGNHLLKTFWWLLVPSVPSAISLCDLLELLWFDLPFLSIPYILDHWHFHYHVILHSCFQTPSHIHLCCCKTSHSVALSGSNNIFVSGWNLIAPCSMNLANEFLSFGLLQHYV